MIVILLSLSFSAVTASAQVAISAESVQMQRLIENSKAQLERLDHILSQAERDSSALEEARQVLRKMTEGLDASIASLQGRDGATDDSERITKWQEALNQAPAGLIPKIQAGAEIENWRTNNRQATQMDELLAAVRAIQEDLKKMREQRDLRGPLSILAEGVDIQNRKLLKGRP